jgi:hypothetical protein
MAVIYTGMFGSGTLPVLEDPRSGSTDLYVERLRLNKTSFAPQFNSKIRIGSTTSDTSTTGQGYNTTSINHHNPLAKQGMLALTKEVSVCTHQTGNSNTYPLLYAIDWRTWGYSMDDLYPVSSVKEFTDGSDKTVMHQVTDPTGAYSYNTRSIWRNPTAGTPLSDITPSYYVSEGATTTGTGGAYEHSGPWVYNKGTWAYGRMSPVTYTNQAQYDGFGRFNIATNAIGTSHTQANGYRTGTFERVQFIGPSSVDAEPIFLSTSHRYNYHHKIYKPNTDANTVTNLHSFTTAGTASGNRGTHNASNHYYPRIASKHFSNPASGQSANRVFYAPALDSNNNYFPWYFTWDKSTDTFATGHCTMAGELSSVSGFTMNTSSSYSGPMTENVALYNETHVLSGTRYVTVIPLCNHSTVAEDNDAERTIITYSVAAADATTLTFHSKEVIPKGIRNITWLNDARTLLGIHQTGGYLIYKMDGTNGWQKATTITTELHCVGRDSADRIFALEANGSGNFKLHAITPTLPVSVSITPAAASYNYTGSIINSTIAVSAFGADGARIAATVGLTISGSTMDFSSGVTTVNINTSTSADVSQAFRITGAGFSDILAAIAL